MMLSALIFFPIGAGLLIALTMQRKSESARLATLLATLIELALLLSLWWQHHPEIALQQHLEWVPALGISYWLKLDGISLLLSLLTAVLGVIATLTGWRQISRWDSFGPLMLTFLGALVGVFLAEDLLLFYVFWEVMLIPMYFMISQWGSAEAKVAATRFLLFTVTASLLMLVAIIVLVIIHANATESLTFSFSELVHTQLTSGQRMLVVLGLLIGFGVKVPLFPLHLWAPSAYRSAHPAVTILLSGAMANAGAYGILRFVLPWLDESGQLPMIGMALATIGALFCAFQAFRQRTMAEVVAYSSISHMNLVLLALFSQQKLAMHGAVIQLLAHGISIAGLFAVIAMLSGRGCLKDLNQMGGLFKPLPVLGGLMLFFVIASVGMPGLGNFAGEILIFAGSFQRSMFWTTLATLSIIFGLVYFLKLYERTMLGPLNESASTLTLTDINHREAFVLGTLAVLSLWLGIYPETFIGPIQHSALQLFHSAPVLQGGLTYVAP